MTPRSGPDFAAALRGRVSTDAMMAHLTKLQDIANANGNTRAVGTPGYDASVDYVVGKLRDKGFDVQTMQFDAHVFHAEPGSVTVADKKFDAHALEYSLATPPVGVTGPAGRRARPTTSPGCNAADYDNLPVNGAVVLVDRGTCPFAQKEDAAVQRGAVAMVVADNVVEEQMGGTLGETTDVKIPVVSVTKSDGALLRTHAGPRDGATLRGDQDHPGPQRDRADQDRVDQRCGDGRGAPRQRSRGPWHQRQRIRCGRGSGDRAAIGQFAGDPQRGAIRLLGC